MSAMTAVRMVAGMQTDLEEENSHLRALLLERTTKLTDMELALALSKSETEGALRELGRLRIQLTETREELDVAVTREADARSRC